MTQNGRIHGFLGVGAAALALVLPPAPAQSRAPQAPESLLPETPAVPEAQAGAQSAVTAPARPTITPAPEIVTQPVIAPLPLDEIVMHWSVADAQALLDAIETIGAEGLKPADYEPDALRAAIARGESDALSLQASKSFTWLAEDLRDGRTPVDARVQWFALDPDRDQMPTALLMAKALDTRDVRGVLASLAPTNPQYQLLKDAFAATPESDKTKRALIRANMDRWRWLPRELGSAYLLTNVPEFQLRLTVNNRNIRTYRTVVGKPGRTATPQLAETVSAVVFNPTWTVPQSIVKGEGLGARLLANPASARRQGYNVTKGADGTIYVVQRPGDNNALGRMKIDMPNPHAIYFHDTPQKALFDTPVRAYSHGCIRTERAVELGMTMAILGAQMSPEEAAEISRAGEYKRVVMTRTFPAYITYFTFGQDIDGNLTRFSDLYGRDAPVLASFEKPRKPKTSQRISDEPVIKLDNPL